MLGDTNVIATVAVKDIAAARDFYGQTLGLPEIEGGPPDPGAVVYRSGTSGLLVYESRYAGTNQATAASWAVGDEFDAIVEELRQRA
jgi:catechol 2,3-dioxygenase-like lactoylglutathione lyase family enzyme